MADETRQETRQETREATREEAVPSVRRRLLAAIAAFALAVASVAFLVVSVKQHVDARADLTHVRKQLAIARATSSSDARELSAARQRLASVHDQVAALGKGVGNLANMDGRDLETVRAAIQGGLAGSLADYNAAVDQRAALDPQHDAAVEQLRQQANAVITALAGIT